MSTLAAKSSGTCLSLLLGAFCLFSPGARAADPILGDLDDDGNITVLDVVRIVELARTGATGASQRTIAIADVNQDGSVNDSDASLAASAAVGVVLFPQLPRLTIRETSPTAGENSVAVTRESIFYLTMPLAENTTIGTDKLKATFGARTILSRVELASDRKTVTLFYTEPLPGSARVRVAFDGTGLTDFLGRPVDLDGDGTPGGIAVLEFETLSLSAVPDTSVVGRVFASEIRQGPGGEEQVINTPLKDVTITVDGMEESMRAVTDVNGNFRLAPCPAGAFFVHIDGRTVTNLAANIRYPDLSYYPFVGKRWTSIAGQEFNIGDVFLPLIIGGTLKQVIAGETTVVKFPDAVVQANPELADVSLEVPPDALFKENGTRGGRIGIAPVPSERLPGPLPAGVNPPIVITVQTDGASNFDRPVGACFPNLPDATTGERLPPGAKTALWSFNHDTGRFEIVGSATVSDDGKVACTDPGVGILAPGWHFLFPGTWFRTMGTDCDPSGSRTRRAPGSQSRPGARPSNDPCNPRNGGNGGTAGDPVYLFSGEMVEQVTDLVIPGRGYDFRWQRTYRSRTGLNTAQGNGWDHPYQVFLLQTGNDLTLHEGTGRGGDVYERQKDGTWTAPEFFRVIQRETDNSLTLIFDDQGKWGFYPFDGSARAGKMSYSQDRNGNRMSFAYDNQGRLSVITDTLGRDIAITYNADGFISAVTDFAGRSVRYAYYQNGDAGGVFGDLKSATSPAVNGTPTGNDFPNGKTVSYTYSKGFADEELNHNLLTVTDGRRNDPNDPTFGSGPYLQNIYATTTDPNDPNYDRVVQQVWGNGSIEFTYIPMLPSRLNSMSVMRVIVNDRVGNVAEHFYDNRNREVRVRQYTGRANPSQPTTLLENRPVNKLRASDPEYFETITEWNDDSLMKRVVHPNGNVTEYVYESDLNPNATARMRGNLRIIRSLPGTHAPAGDQEGIEQRFDYNSDFASCCGFNFVIRESDGRGNVTRHEYDTKGNRIRTRGALGEAVYEWEYNSFGQMTARINAPDANGHRRRDVLEYYESGPQRGYLRREIVDATGLQLATHFEYDATGNIVRTIDPRGNDTLRIVNALNQQVRVSSPEVTPGSGIRYVRDYFYDANDNMVRADVRNIDENGVVQANTDFTTKFDYDILNAPIRITEEIDPARSAVTEFEYDANRNRILTRFPEATSGRQPANVARVTYDERNMQFQSIAAPGDALQSTSQTDYDRNGNIVRISEGIESGARVTTFEFDGYNRLVGTTDAMGNRMRRQYDAAGNIVREWTEGELVDVPGGANNVRLREITRVFDVLNRVTREERAHFNRATQQLIGDGKSTRAIEYDAFSQIRRAINDNGHSTWFGYDTASRLVEIADAKGNYVQREYDRNGNVVTMTSSETSDLGGDATVHIARAVFDGLNREIRTINAAGNINDVRYDSRNLVRETIDAARAAENGPGNRVRREYDGLGHLTTVTRLLTANGTGSGAAAGQITTRNEWDDNGRLVATFDGNGNPTRFVYDALDRMIRSTFADGKSKTTSYNAHSDAVTSSDPNGTVVQQSFDARGRVTRKEITVGAGVAADTTFETRSHDGLGRVVRAENNSTEVLFAHDSLNNVAVESIDGRVVRRAFDGLGNAVETTYPGGRKLAAIYDELEQLKSLTDTTAGPVSIAQYSYAGINRVARRAHGNNTRMDLAYDSLSRITRSAHSAAAPFEDREYAWDKNNNKTLDRDRLAGGFEQNFSFDSIYRLKDVSFAGSINEQRTYQWDAVGNRVSVNGDGDAGNYVLAAAPSNDAALNQYTSTPFDQRSYDSNGNLTRITAGPEITNLQFDYMNRLVRFEAGGKTTRYVYDAFGRRVEKIEGENVTRYSYMGAQMIEEQDGNGAVRASYVFGSSLNEVVSMQRGGNNYWFHADQLMSVRKVTDASGAVAERYEYDEFGSPALFNAGGQPIAQSAIGNPFLYTGHQYDAESGLIYARNRHYDPRAGRFVSRDPSGAWTDPSALGNAYAYAGNNPSSYVDLMGLASMAPQAEEFLTPAISALGDQFSHRANGLLDAAGKAAGEADRLNSQLANEMLDWVEHMTSGNYHALDPATGQLTKITYSTEEAVGMVNMMYGMGRPTGGIMHARDLDVIFQDGQQIVRRSWHYADTVDRIADLEKNAGRMAQQGSRLARAGKYLGYAATAIETYQAISDNRKNCADAFVMVNDVGATVGGNLFMNAVSATAPPVALVDLATGGAVSGMVHNAFATPGNLLRLTGRVNGRDAAAIKGTYTRTWLGRGLWSAGEWLADKVM